jgi:3-keto-disaccharide hydrolase
MLTKFTTLIMTVFFVSSIALAQDQPMVISAPEGGVPSDAIVLFDGANLSEWQYTDGRPAGWIVGSKGGIVTKRDFGDMQIHLEFMSPPNSTGEGQDRGNSGIYVHGAYEVQILDSYKNETYANGMLGAVYEQHVPLVNAARPPGVWQSYDIIFRAPRFDSDGIITARPTFTVLLNGVLIQDNVEIQGPTRASIRQTEGPKGPIFLQDHSHPVKYRNIWVREL